MKEYFNQKVKWYKKTGNNAYGQPIYAPAVEIPCRYEERMKLIRDKQGKESVSQGTFYLIEKVGLDDKLEYEGKQFNVMNYSDTVNLDGVFLFRKVWV
ncbi:hypothetical protein ABG79_02183 [Caloramator mitchellensis]|uniref:Phage head-tail joining protein n=1 Tax=Caloramator mitchellensis TaxID=908809 RepID=A0A0R3JRE2_CALMK|nr:hypothetical protein [Caloramator mitchellensis]KRQ86051.1 hypothetical protein ABG79_02183 [Caloramator mitchellensis]